MRKWLFVTCVVLLLASLALLVYAPLMFAPPQPTAALQEHPADSAHPGIEGTLTFCSDIWPPYVSAPGEPLRGYAVDLLQAIYAPAGYTVERVIAPWSRCLHEVNNGNITGAIGTDRDEAPDLSFPREAIGVYRPRFYTLPESRWRYRGLDSLSEVRLGVIQGYSYAPDLDLYIQQHAHSERLLFSKGESPLEHLFTALHKGQIDVFIENLQTTETFMKTRTPSSAPLRIAGELPVDHPLYVAFNPTADHRNGLAMRYERRIQKLRRDGALALLMGRYGLTDWQPRAPQTRQTSQGEKHP